MLLNDLVIIRLFDDLATLLFAGSKKVLNRDVVFGLNFYLLFVVENWD